MKARNIISNVLIGLMLFCLCAPFLTIILYFRSTNGLLLAACELAAVFLIALLFIIFCTVERRKYYRISILYSIIGAFIFFCISYYFQLEAADYVFYKVRERKLNEFVSEIKKYAKINEMTDGKRGVDRINYSHYYFDKKELFGVVDTSRYLYKDLINKLDIDEQVHKKFCDNLSAIDCYEFYCTDDGAICFTVNSFLQHANGITYSENGVPHGSRGTIKMWKKIADNWYLWGS